MVTDSFDRDPDDELPEPQRLAAWTVPILSDAFADRVVAIWQGAAQFEAPAPRRARGPTRATIVGAVAAVLAAAATLVLVLALHRDATEILEPSSPPAVANDVEVAPTSAVISIDVKPRDATVAIDGRPLPGVAPFVVADLPLGRHDIAIRRSGFVPFATSIELAAGGLRVEFSLDIADVVLDVVVDPPNADVRVVTDERELGRRVGSGRLAVQRQGSEDVTLEVAAPGFTARRVPMRFSGAPQDRVEIVLVPDPSAAGPLVDPSPRSPRSTPTAKSKTHTDLKDPFRGESSDELDDGAADTSLKDPFHKAPPAAKTATLRIGVVPGFGPAKVSVDGKLVGLTPIAAHRVTPGLHRVKWVWSDGHSFTELVSLAEGETKTVKGG